MNIFSSHKQVCDRQRDLCFYSGSWQDILMHLTDQSFDWPVSFVVSLWSQAVHMFLMKSGQTCANLTIDITIDDCLHDGSPIFGFQLIRMLNNKIHSISWHVIIILFLKTCFTLFNFYWPSKKRCGDQYFYCCILTTIDTLFSFMFSMHI